MALPSPAPRSTMTSWPWSASSRAPAGVNPTRYSSDLISLATPILIVGRATLVAAWRVGQSLRYADAVHRPRRPSQHGLLVGAAESVPEPFALSAHSRCRHA